MFEITKAAPANTMMAVFLCSLGNSRYTFKNGKDAVFLGGRYLTNNEAEFRELMEEIQTGHPHISVPENPDDQIVDTKYVDPMEALRASIRADLIAEQAAIRNSKADMGTSDQAEKLNVGTTLSVGEAMSGSTSGDGAAGVTAAGVASAGTAAIAPQVTMGAKIAVSVKK